MKKVAVSVFLACLVASMASAAVKIVSVNSAQKAGWMPGGWGQSLFVFENDSAEPAKIIQATGEWVAHGEVVNGPWTDDNPNDFPAIKAKGQTKWYKLGYLPKDVSEKALPAPALLRGTVTVEQGGEKQVLKYEVGIAGAKLKEPLKTLKGPFVSYSLIESRYNAFEAKEKMLRWMNQSYVAMQELTGATPDDGRNLLIEESPEHPWWAYAGNPIVMDTTCMQGVIDDAQRGIVPFGWVHEIGHVFDVYGPWYIFNGPSCEMQANFKLMYAMETLDDRGIRMNFAKYTNGTYKPRLKGFDGVSPRQFTDAFFTFFGDRYLADPSKDWENMESDDWQSFLMRIQRSYGWDPFKLMYRKYKQLDELGYEPPKEEERIEKINLQAAILCNTVGIDLVPVYQLWRIPVTYEKIEEMKKRYPVDDPNPAPVKKGKVRK